MENYKIIDLNSFNRKSHFEHFSSLPYPYVGLTANVDVTKLLTMCKKNKYSFYFSCVYVFIHALNRIPELRRRIKDNQIIEYDYCIASTTEGKDDETYVYCNYPTIDNYEGFQLKAKEVRKQHLKNTGLKEEGDVGQMVFMSCIPWVSFTQIVQPLGGLYDSNPHITWGQFFNEGDKTLMPISILCHHSLVDGIHLGKFYKFIDEEIDIICK